MQIKIGNKLLPIPKVIWQWGAQRTAKKITAGLRFMTKDHHRVRNFVVSEIAQNGKAVSPELISERLDLGPEQVDSILSKLERKLMFLYRSDSRSVDWAYPVTCAESPHTLAFQNGDRMNAA